MRSKHYKVRCVADFTHVTPATILNDTVEFPEKRIAYEAGQVFELSGARVRKEFCRAFPGVFEPID